MALQNEYRPDSLESFFGNDTTIDAVKSAVLRDIPPKAYLITGDAGCGKTTLAYIIRDMLGCTQSAFHEFDASADRGIDKIRKIKEEAQLLPMTGNILVLFFDECHQITGPAQEAMLKLLEDPPPHVYLILATTEPSKLKKSIIRRCTQFAVDRLNRAKTMELLEQICDAEDKTWHTKKLFSKIYKVCWGSPGQAVKLLDQVIDIKDDALAIEAIQNVTFDETLVIDLCRMLVDKKIPGSKKWDKAREMLKNFKGDPESARYAVLGYLNKVLLNSGSLMVAKVITLFTDSFMFAGKAGLTLAFFYACKDYEDMENKSRQRK
jgi:DNA polymerase-3 subunit gamma/tau